MVLIMSLLTIVLFMNLSTMSIDISFSGFATVITPLITLFTLFEIRQQRKKMYEPALSFMKNDISLNKDTEFKDQHFFLHNIGFGAAKEVIVEWDYYNKLERVKKIIPDLDKKDFVQLNNFYNKNESFISKYNDQKQELEDLLPSSISREPVNIRLPKIAINYFINFYNEELIRKGNMSVNPVIELPFTVKYSDINNKKYNRKFTLSFSFTRYSPNELDASLFVNRK